MQLHPDLKYALDGISFRKQYKQIVKRFSFDISESFEDYSPNEVLKIINEFGYETKFIKRENFFKISEVIQPFQFQFNISLKYGVVELIWDILKDNQRLHFGWGTWGSVSDILDDSEKLKNPIFRNYEDLLDILKEAFSIYENFKEALIQQENPA
ncbi:hypothetical protein GCM10027592_63470 [Spirosoma flavus]